LVPISEAGVNAGQRTGDGQGRWLPGLLQALFDLTLDFAFGIAVSQTFPFVIRVLALGQADLNLGTVVLEIEARGHDGIAALFHLGPQTLDLLAVQQQLAIAHRVVIEIAGLVVAGDVSPYQPGFAVAKGDITVAQVDPAGPDRFYLRPMQSQASLKRL